MNARYSYPTKAEAEAYAERPRDDFQCGVFWNGHTLEGFLVAPHHYTLDNKPASWGVIAPDHGAKVIPVYLTLALQEK